MSDKLHQGLLAMIAGFEGFDPVMREDGDERTPTIAHGFNLLRSDAKNRIRSLGLDWDGLMAKRVRVTREQGLALLRPLVEEAFIIARQMFSSSWAQHPVEVLDILVDLAYNHGAPRLGKFVGFREAMARGRYALAACELVFSELGNPKTSGYWSDTKDRAKRHASKLAWVEKVRMQGAG